MIKTHEELFQKLKEYESKWGKLGHTNIMQPELNHTGLKGGSKMLKMDNEYYEFRRKVAEGSKKNRLAHASTISPDELNERYEQELVDRGSLIHAANGMKGQQFQNTKYYKREGEPGHYRYYYTKEEWDAAHRSPESSENKANAHKQNIAPAQEPAKDTKNFIHNAQADSVKKYAEIAKKSPKAAAEEIVKNNDMGLEDMFHEIEEAFKSGSIKWNKDNLVPGENGNDEFEKAKEWIEEASNAAEKFCKDIDKSAGTGGDTFRAVRDLVRERVNEMAEKYATKPMEKKVTKDNIKHSADESSVITSSAMGDEIIDEYKAFQEKVKAGAERHRLAHSSFISPEELNAKYQEELENNRILCHASNYKYYNKIDLGNGQTRYFYTKAEWDAYQDGKKQTNYREDQKADARQAEINKQKETAAQKQGMTGYNKYQENLKEDQKADARENAKKEASNRSGMNDYEEWKKNQDKKNTGSSNISKDIQKYDTTLKQLKETDRSLNVQVAQNKREAEEKAAQKANQKLYQDYRKNSETLDAETGLINKFKKELEDKKRKESEDDRDFGDKRDEKFKEWMDKNGRKNISEAIDEFNKAAKDYGYDMKMSYSGGWSTNDKKTYDKVNECYKWINQFEKNIEELDKLLSDKNIDKYKKMEYEASKALMKRQALEYENMIEDLWIKDRKNAEKIFDEILDHMNNDILYEHKLYENII